MGIFFYLIQSERDKEGYSFKAVGAKCSCSVQRDEPYPNLWVQLMGMEEGDEACEFRTVGSLVESDGGQ